MATNSSLGVVRPDMYDAEATDRYMVELIQAGYQPLGAEWHDPAGSSLDYYNQTYGLQLRDLSDYYKYIYGLPNAEVINDPVHGQLLKLPEGFDAFSKPGLTYNPNPNEELMQAILAGTVAFGGAAALGAAGALGTGVAAGTGAGAAGIESAVAGGALTGGAGATAAGSTLPASYWSMLAGDAPAGGISGLGATDALGAELAGYWNPAAYGAELGAGGAEVAAGGAMDMFGSAGSGIPGSGPASQLSYASLYGPAAASGVAGAAGTASKASSLASLLKSMGVSEETANTIGSFLPNATIASLLTGLGQGALGYLGAQKQADAVVEAQRMQNEALQRSIDFAKAESEKYWGMGAPYRERLDASYKPEFSIWDDPATKDAATQASNIAARSYSATAGNPFDQPASQGGIYRDVLQQVALPQLNTYRNQLGTFGQLGTTAAGSLTGSAVNNMAAQGNNAFQGIEYAGSGLNAVGAGLSTALNPPLTRNDLLEMMKTYKPTV